MKSFKQHLHEQIGSWHEAIRSNEFNLSPEDHNSAKAFLKLAYKTARHTPMYLDTLNTLHDFLVRKGVETAHPAMRELSSIKADTERMYKEKELMNAHRILNSEEL